MIHIVRTSTKVPDERLHSNLPAQESASRYFATMEMVLEQATVLGFADDRRTSLANVLTGRRACDGIQAHADRT